MRKRSEDAVENILLPGTSSKMTCWMFWGGVQVLTEIPMRPLFISTGAFPDVIRVVYRHTHSIHTTEQHEELSRVHDLVFHWSLHSLVLNKNTVQVLSEFSTRNDLIHRDLGCAVYFLRRITADLMFTFDWFSILCLLTTPTPLFSPASQRVIYLPFRHYIMWDSLCLRHPHDRKRNHESLCARSNYLPRQIWSFSKIVDTCLHGLVEFSQWGLIPKLTFWSFSRTSCYLSIYLYRTLSRHFKLKPQASII